MLQYCSTGQDQLVLETDGGGLCSDLGPCSTAALRVGRWRLSWCRAVAQYDVYTAAANIFPSHHFPTLSTSTLFKICHSMLSTKWQDCTICLSLVDTFFQNLSLPLIGWQSCQLSVTLPALPPAQASTLDMLSSYMDRVIIRHKFSLTFRTKN